MAEAKRSLIGLDAFPFSNAFSFLHLNIRIMKKNCENFNKLLKNLGVNHSVLIFFINISNILEEEVGASL